MATSSVSIAIDGRALVGNPTGIGTHTAEIASRLAVDPPPLIASHRRVARLRNIEHCRFRVEPSRLGVWWQQVDFPSIVREEHCNVVWGPHGTLPLALNVPAVSTIHDLTSITMPGRHRFKTILSYNPLIGRSLDKATSIAVVSRTTADELMRSFGVESGRITIVPNGVDSFFSPPDLEEPPLPPGVEGDYILYAGTIEPRKGVADLLTAWESLPVRPRLVLCGDPGWGASDLRKRIEELASDDIVVTGYVDRRILRALYRSARLFVYPSHYEGFGLPPLEAMACGTPVVAAAGGAIPEIVGDAAIVVPPANPDALREAIARVLRNSALAAELSERGRRQAALYSWDRSAQLMQALLVRAAGA